jgi:hypothetical protein
MTHHTMCPINWGLLIKYFNESWSTWNKKWIT